MALAATSQAAAPATDTSLPDVIARAAPAVAQLLAVMSPGIPGRPLASAVIFDARAGLVVSCAHRLGDGHDWRVHLADGRELAATLAGRDELSDVAVLKVSAAALPSLPPASTALRIGSSVVGIGNPFGSRHTLELGLVSATGHDTQNPDGAADFIQTSILVGSGNDCGALVNLRGEWLGLLTALPAERQRDNYGVGYALPFSSLRAIATQLAQNGSVRRGLLGVSVTTITPDMASALGLTDTPGVIVSQVLPGSAAARAGVLSGDVIVALDGRPVGSNSELLRHIAARAPGDRVQITLRREHMPLQISAQLGSSESAAWPQRD
ncbi:MAG: trypsin-like peptidase domain-containing protein [Steroidobacteraceae bacterium]